MTEAKTTPKKETTPTEDKPKKIKRLSKIEVKKVVTSLMIKTLTGKQLESLHHLSSVSATKIKSVMSNTNWKKVCEDTPLPQGYVSPKNLQQTIMSVMYDKGFTI